MSQFAALLEADAEKLVQQWTKALGATASTSRLRERLPHLLRSLVTTLRQGESQGTEPPAIQFGFDVQGVVREYGALASVLLDAAEASGTSVSPADVRVFTRFMANAVAQSVAVHGAVQAEAQRSNEVAVHAARSEKILADARRDQLHHAQLARESVEVRRREERLRRLLEATGAGGYEVDVAAQTVDADDTVFELHNVAPAPGVSMETFISALHPDDRGHARAAFASALDPQGSRRHQVQYRVLGKGGFRWIEATGRTLFNDSGAPVHLVGTTIDITQRKEAELAREGLLEALRDQPLLSMIVLEGPQLIVKMVNGVHAEHRKKLPGDIVGKPVFDAYPHLAGKFEDLMKGVLQTGKPVVLRQAHRPLDRGDGVLEDHYIDLVIQPLRGRLGTIDGIINISVDVTESVKQRRALENLGYRFDSKP